MFLNFRKASIHVRELRASGETYAFSLGLRLGLHFLCFARPHLVRTRVRCVRYMESHPCAQSNALSAPSQAGVKTPQANELPSLALPVPTSATPMASFLRSSKGGGTPGHVPHLGYSPRQTRRHRIPTARVHFASGKHKK